jgi:hypothetical protein
VVGICCRRENREVRCYSGIHHIHQYTLYSEFCDVLCVWLLAMQLLDLAYDLAAIQVYYWVFLLCGLTLGFKDYY